VNADGTPGWEPTPYVDAKTETFAQKQEAHNPNCFNLKRSNSLALDRAIPDVRNPLCQSLQYDDLPQVSVIFVFFNEPLSPFIRSIRSVLDRTPAHLLREIILVDDGSDRDYTQKPLEDYLRLLPKVTLRRMPERQGLMATRVEGAKIATSDVIVFLDSHIECNIGWLEPMIARIKENPKVLTVPMIDGLDADDFHYTAGGLDVVAFDWGLRQAFPKRPITGVEPVDSPGMGGGLFAINRKLFFDLGGYDPGMKLYGGEEVELPMRIWMCGYRLEVIPCSRVGHIFRSGKYHHGQVYSVPGYVITKNHLRAAKMWIEPEFYHLVAKANSRLPAGQEIGDLSWGTEIKQRLKCKSFRWFLDNVYPELFIPGDPKFVLATGYLRNPSQNLCLDTFGRTSDDSKLGAYQCHDKVSDGSTQSFVLTKLEEVRLATGTFSSCFDRANKVDGVYIWGCHLGHGNQEWKYNQDKGHLYDPNNNACVTLYKQDKGGHSVSMKPCSDDNKDQEWRVVSVPKT